MAFSQEKQSEWSYQWSRLEDRNRWLFDDWIFPNRLEDFKGKTVLDAGCGGGHHVEYVAPVAGRVVGVDLNCPELARQRTASFRNVDIVEGDVARWSPSDGTVFDVVYCVGVIHHTDDPDQTFRHLVRLVRPGGRLIVWTYSEEGNFLNRAVLEPLKKVFFGFLPRPLLLAVAHAMTVLLYPPVYSVYLLPLRFLPYYDYFANFRRLGYRRNMLNVFDKLNAPQTHFISESRIRGWFSADLFEDVHVSPYVGVSWRGSGTRRT
ncbi:MAG TPA: class I SAM-dependent methyltransferase [Elusimicrobiota bacterium]|nr:class I SAM-dependent methyltransferase [Elusimicrobiota bacterium]